MTAAKLQHIPQLVRQQYVAAIEAGDAFFFRVGRPHCEGPKCPETCAMANSNRAGALEEAQSTSLSGRRGAS